MDGSHLMELLLERGYDVWGMMRRSSNLNTMRIDHCFDHRHLFLRHGEITDGSSISRILSEIEKKYGNELERLEFYNLAGMSHVRVSFEQPEYTADVNGLGTLKCLEAIMQSGLKDKVRFYQASTSELFGAVQEIPQSETTPFYPRSPYAIAKLFSYWTTKNYREAYGLFACNGILFNHESVPGHCPILHKINGIISIRPMRDVSHADIQVLDHDGWTDVLAISRYEDENKKIIEITKDGIRLELTEGHPVMLDALQEKKCQDVIQTDRLLRTPLFEYTDIYEMCEEECEIIGIMMKNNRIIRTDGTVHIPHNNNEDTRILHMFLWNRMCKHHMMVSQYESNKSDTIFKIQEYHLSRMDFLNMDGSLRIPDMILNATENGRRAFIRGFGDWTDDTSECVLQGLFFLHPAYLTRYKTFKKNVYIKHERYDYYDIETKSGFYHCGIGNGVVHNSPRRGATFVTRKITLGLKKILSGESDRLLLGNLDARRDWGHARDYCDGMWRMLQNSYPDDYVLATGRSHTVREFVEKAFRLRGIVIVWRGSGIDEVGYDAKTGRELIFIHPKYFRPTEVNLLMGDATKAREELDWRPTITFDELIREMVDHDCPPLVLADDNK